VHSEEGNHLENRPEVMPVEKSEMAVLRHAVAQDQVVRNE
jgi:hypothetical protein